MSHAAAQTAVVIAPVPQLQFFDQNGVPLAFGCVFTYQSQTTNNLQTYTDSTGDTENQNPVILSAGGSANIWLAAGQAYTFRVKSSGGTHCADGATLYTVNGIGGGSTVLTTNVTYSSTPSFIDAAQVQLFLLTLTGDASAQPMTFVGVTPPGIIYFQISQDGSGGHSFSWPANTVGGCTIGATADQVTTQEFVYDGSNATAVGPCVIGNGPAIDTGPIVATGAISTDTSVTSPAFISASTHPALSGVLRLANLDGINWRNAANSNGYGITTDSSDRGVFSFTGGLELDGTVSNIFLGGLTSSFPMIKQNSAAINFRLADDSGDAAITAGAVNAKTSFVLNGSQTFTGVQGSTGTKLFACTGSIASGHSVVVDANGNCVDGGYDQWESVSPGCTASGTPCTVTLTWPNSFSDTSYFVNCTATAEASNSIGAFWVSAKATGTITISVDNRGTSNPGGFDSFDCHGHHP